MGRTGLKRWRSIAITSISLSETLRGPAEDRFFAKVCASSLWKVVQPKLYWREWGGDSVVFDEASGQTHQFSPLAAAAMAWLEEQHHSATSLSTGIARYLDIEPTAEVLQSICAVLDQFRELDWIEPLTPAA